MEAAGGTIGGLTGHRAEGPGARGLASAGVPTTAGANALQSLPADGGSSVLEVDVVDEALALLSADAITAEDTALWGFRQATDFADRLEQLSRKVERLQVLAAGAVDRSRTAALTQAASPLAPSPSLMARARGQVMTDPATASSSSGPGCGSPPPKPAAGSDWPTLSCPVQGSPRSSSRPATKNSPPRSAPPRSAPARQPPSSWPWTGPGTLLPRPTRPRWNTT
jgi:hypothetical protein